MGYCAIELSGRDWTMTLRNIALRTCVTPPLPCGPSMNDIRDDQVPLRTYSTGFAVQRMMFSRKVALTIMSLWRGHVLAYQLKENRQDCLQLIYA
jgi:hypothetical protein